MKTDVQLADEGIYYMGSEAALEEECSELETINFEDCEWSGPNFYQFDYENGNIFPVEVEGR